MHARGRRSLCGWLLAGAMLAGCASSPDQGDPGATSRTLPEAEVDALLAGEGFGMAAPAEINGYPGPVHVLELKEELELTPDQRFATSRLVGLVRGQARALGQRIVDAERRLDADLAEGNITGAQVRARLETIASLRAQLRFTHIDAHLEQKKILKPEQVARYYELRGRVVLREPMLPPEPVEPLALPVEATAATPPEDETPSVMPAPSVAPVLPSLPMDAETEAAPAETPTPLPQEEPAPVREPADDLPALPAEETPPVEATPFEEEKPVEDVPLLSPGAQDAMEDAEPAREPPAYPLTPIEENPAPPALLLDDAPVEEDPTEEEKPVEDVPALSPGAQDAMEHAEPAREPPAYPLTPVEENPAPPALLLDDAPVEEESTEEEKPVEDVPALSPGAQDAMEDAEPAREPPAYPLTPVEETPAQPPALLLEEPIEEEAPAREAPEYPLTPVEETSPVEEASAPETLPDQRALSPGMQDAIEFAEPDSGTVEPAPEGPVYIAPLEDEEELQELEPTDLREPVTIDLDN